MSWYPFPNSRPTQANVGNIVSIAVTGNLLALVSSVTTATARALLKTGKDKLAIRGMIAGTSAILMLLICFFVSLPTAVLLPWLGLCSLLHTIYQLVLIRSCRLNGFSMAFPWAMFIAAVVFKEDVGPRKGFGAAMSAVGAILIIYRSA